MNSFLQVKGTCLFGENCKYMHNVEEYMKLKREDLGPECYSYRKHGRCQYGFACRFGADHICNDVDKGSYFDMHPLLLLLKKLVLQVVQVNDTVDGRPHIILFLFLDSIQVTRASDAFFYTR